MSAVPKPVGGEPMPERRARERSVVAGDIAMTAGDFDRVRTMIYRFAGITLADSKRAMVYSRLSRRLRETRHPAFSVYLDWLESLVGDALVEERQAFVNCLTTNLTAFFREAHHFEILAAALRARRSGPIRIWCSASSTGEEPYSLAMTGIDTLGDRPDLSILASDIDTRVLATAREGIYLAEARGLTDAHRRRHFLRGTGPNAGAIRVRPHLGRLIEFRPFNLMDAHWSTGEPFDIVFCRNVMIYFDAPTQRKVLERMHRVIKPEGLLFAGHSENFADSRDLFRLRGQTVYERV